MTSLKKPFALFFLLFSSLSFAQFNQPAGKKTLSATGFFKLKKEGKLLPFAPQYPLWTDGAKKDRYIFIPKGKKINVDDMDRWEFPVGTKFYKHFKFKGKVAETRLIEKHCELTPEENERAMKLRSRPGFVPGDIKTHIDCWAFYTYHWETEKDAVLVPEKGKQNVIDTGFKTKHDLPALTSCTACHDRGGDPILGFDALQLSDDRDPRAAHASKRNRLPKNYLTLNKLKKKGLLSHNLPIKPPRIMAKGYARAAIGYLHGNCSSCHNSMSRYPPLKSSWNARHSVFLEDKTEMDDVGRNEVVYKSSIDKKVKTWASAPNPNPQGPSRVYNYKYADPRGFDNLSDEQKECFKKHPLVISKGNPDCSVLYFRLTSRFNPFSLDSLEANGFVDRTTAGQNGIPDVPEFFEWKQEQLRKFGQTPKGKEAGFYYFKEFEQNHRMPFVGTEVIDEKGSKLIAGWIKSLGRVGKYPEGYCPQDDRKHKVRFDFIHSLGRFTNIDFKKVFPECFKLYENALYEAILTALTATERNLFLHRETPAKYDLKAFIKKFLDLTVTRKGKTYRYNLFKMVDEVLNKPNIDPLKEVNANGSKQLNTIIRKNIFYYLYKKKGEKSLKFLVEKKYNYRYRRFNFEFTRDFQKEIKKFIQVNE